MGSMPAPTTFASFWPSNWGIGAQLRLSNDGRSSVNAGKGSTPNLPDDPFLLLAGLSLLSWLPRRCFRCLCSSQPSEPNDPLLMSTSEGAFEATLPVAAHMPGGGFASMSFMLALRILLDAEEALVDVRARAFVGLEPS